MRSKAEVLYSLKDKNKHFLIPKMIYFSRREWDKKRSLLIRKISHTFKGAKVAIRSSSTKEDTKNFSNAGRYLSFLNISSKNKKLVTKKIENIFFDYTSKHKKNYRDQILIQEMVKNVKMSGVIFSQDLENGAPYYCINYDDITGKTNTVTSGLNRYSNKSLYILRGKEKALRSERFIKIIRATKELEKKLNSDRLDIEFSLDKKGSFVLFQVRGLKKIKRLIKSELNELISKLSKVAKTIQSKIKRKKGLYGRKNIFGIMPDWNPVEMIGLHPSNFSTSLYKSLITDSSWLKARELMGYHTFKDTKLMETFLGTPYIDVRKSFNSLLPRKINKKIANKIIDSAIERLKSNPSFHDKVEFEVMPNCFFFDFRNKFRKNYKNINLKELKFLETKYKDLFIYNLTNYATSVEGSLFKIKELEKKIFKKKKINLNEIKSNLNDCRQLGIIPFSILARHAFAAKEILNSLVRLKIFSPKDLEFIENNNNTITKEFLIDLKKCSLKKIKFSEFLDRYGHLRPGTYDLSSKNYKEIYKKNTQNKNYKIKIGGLKKILLHLKNKKKKVNTLLKKEKIPINFEKLINYILQSISGREYAKFVFSRCISLTIDCIKNYSNKSKIKLKDLENIDIKIFSENISKKKLISISNKETNERKINLLGKLPQLITDPTYSCVVPYQMNIPNFITNFSIIKNTVKVNSHKDMSLKDKIVIINSADPGYDWIFSKSVAGLITQYGGANSHMAIRCAELNIPAAIGCGEQFFKLLSDSNLLELNCSKNNIRILN